MKKIEDFKKGEFCQIEFLASHGVKKEPMTSKMKWVKKNCLFQYFDDETFTVLTEDNSLISIERKFGDELRSVVAIDQPEKEHVPSVDFVESEVELHDIVFKQCYLRNDLHGSLKRLENIESYRLKPTEDHIKKMVEWNLWRFFGDKHEKFGVDPHEFLTHQYDINYQMFKEGEVPDLSPIVKRVNHDFEQEINFSSVFSLFSECLKTNEKNSLDALEKIKNDFATPVDMETINKVYDRLVYYFKSENHVRILYVPEYLEYYENNVVKKSIPEEDQIKDSKVKMNHQELHDSLFKHCAQCATKEKAVLRLFNLSKYKDFIVTTRMKELVNHNLQRYYNLKQLPFKTNISIDDFLKNKVVRNWSILDENKTS